MLSRINWQTPIESRDGPPGDATSSASKSKARAVPAHNGLRLYDGERVASAWKQAADPSQHQPIRGHKRPSGRFRPPQHNDLLPKHKDFCFQRRSRPKQIDDETKYQSNDNQYQAQRRPILCAAPTGFIYDRWGIGARRFGGLAGLVASLRVDD